MDKSKYYCEKCNYSTNLKNSWKQHCETTLHKTGKRKVRKDKLDKEYKCEKCDYISKNKNNYLTHILNNHSTKEEKKKGFKYYCESCDFGVFVKSMFDKHLATNKHKMITFEKTI